ncbi:MAG TPA: gas vesicle protein [Thermoanaerobaculia bacterium]|nr:gas vesicle protein [Thermoanaerobaculia bacterium]
MSPREDGEEGQAALELFEGGEGSLLDLADHLLNQGVVLTGDVVIGLANVDLIYLRLSVLLCAADRVLPQAETPETTKP